MLELRPVRWALSGFMAVVCVFALSASTALAKAAPPTKTPKPVKISPADQALVNYAGTNWDENGGDVENDRYSTLTQISKSNVGSLGLAWQNNLNVCASTIAKTSTFQGINSSSCGSEEATPVEDNGTLFIQTNTDGVFALNATTGAVVWHWVPPFSTWDPGFSLGSGGRQPGVAVGGGKVYVALADGSLVALNEATGAVYWRTITGPWQEGVRLSSAPLYYNGMLIVPTSGGDSGSISATVSAYSAIDGAVLWTWGVVPQAGQPGANTWSTLNGGAYTSNIYGGGALWQTPAIDAKDNLVIFGTGNPVPWNSRGSGNNLYTDSLVALDYRTGVLKWYYQTVHHDLWDSDLPNNVIVFNTKMKLPETVKNKKGKKVTKKVLQPVTVAGDVAKYGWTWLLNAATGKPLTKVDQVKVPQDAASGVNTSATQPIPQTPNTLVFSNGAGFPLMKNGQGRVCADPKFWISPNDIWNNPDPGTTLGNTPDGHPVVFGCDFQPYDTSQWIVTPFENMDWPSSSYDPQTQGFVTCGDIGREYGHEQIPAASEVVTRSGGIGSGVLSLGGNIPGTNTGTFSSLNVVTNKWEFHQNWSQICFSGSANTASGITFVGQLGPGASGNGYLEAVDSKTGQELWQSPPMPNVEVSAPPITYMVNGVQYVAGIAGGESHENPIPSSAPGTKAQPVGTAPDTGFGSLVYAFAVPGA
jgi:quinohemoprotein ethanol dehydrogenase